MFGVVHVIMIVYFPSQQLPMSSVFVFFEKVGFACNKYAILPFKKKTESGYYP